jgi:hypothetical protein
LRNNGQHGVEARLLDVRQQGSSAEVHTHMACSDNTGNE